MGRRISIFGAALATFVALGLAFSQTVTPPYHHAPPKGSLPATLRPDQFSDPVVRNCYALAATIKKTLYQLPCYCPCWRTEGHKSLLDCYITKHASLCDWCQQEAVYAYLQQRKGLSVAEIRAGIEKGEWKKVNLAQFSSLGASRLPAARK
jgi:hypothetical protein